VGELVGAGEGVAAAWRGAAPGVSVGLGGVVEETGVGVLVGSDGGEITSGIAVEIAGAAVTFAVDVAARGAAPHAVPDASAAMTSTTTGDFIVQFMRTTHA
jgi:hypothetical protein